ncbi:MAG: hypothetical protein ACLP9L_13530 [Thermoguttaceae bacterium]
MFEHLFSGRADPKSSAGQHRPVGKPRSNRADRTLQLESLENRSLLSASAGLASTFLGAGSAVPALHGPATPQGTWTESVATQLSLRLPQAVASGTPVTVSVDALSATNGLARGFTGTLTVSSSAANAVLPTNNGEIAFHNGVVTFQVTFPTAAAGTTLTVTDNSTPPLTAKATTNVVDPTVVTGFDLYLPGDVRVNAPVTVRAVAENGLGRPVSAYTGMLTVSSSAANAVLPTNNGEIAFHNGVATFQVTFPTAAAGTTLTVTDNSTPPLTAKATTNVVDPTVATQFVVRAPHDAAINTPFKVTVTALNGFGTPVTTYTGPVTLSSSDANAILPAASTISFTNGEATFSVTLVAPSTSAKPTTLTVADNSSPTPNASLTKTVSIVAVDPTVVTGFKVFLPPAVQIATATTVQVTAVNGLGGAVTGYVGPITVVSSDASAVISPTPSTIIFTNGEASFSVTFKTTGSQSLTVSDANSPTLTETVKTYVG